MRRFVRDEQAQDAGSFKMCFSTPRSIPRDSGLAFVGSAGLALDVPATAPARRADGAGLETGWGAIGGSVICAAHRLALRWQLRPLLRSESGPHAHQRQSKWPAVLSIRAVLSPSMRT